MDSGTSPSWSTARQISPLIFTQTSSRRHRECVRYLGEESNQNRLSDLAVIAGYRDRVTAP